MSAPTMCEEMSHYKRDIGQQQECLTFVPMNGHRYVEKRAMDAWNLGRQTTAEDQLWCDL